MLRQTSLISSMCIVVMFVLLGLCIHPVQSLYFHINESEMKCFIEEVPDDTMVVGTYNVQKFDASKNEFAKTAPGTGIHVEVKDPSQKIIMDKDYEARGRFTFTTHDAGEHKICLHTNTTRWFGGSKLRVHLAIDVGESTNDYEQIAKTEKLSELQLRARQVVDQVTQIQKEQAYQRFREQRFRYTSESTNSRVFWWSLVQTLILVAIGYWQFNNLTSFFRHKKLV